MILGKLHTLKLFCLFRYVYKVVSYRLHPISDIDAVLLISKLVLKMLNGVQLSTCCHSMWELSTCDYVKVLTCQARFPQVVLLHLN